MSIDKPSSRLAAALATFVLLVPAAGHAQGPDVSRVRRPVGDNTVQGTAAQQAGQQAAPQVAQDAALKGSAEVVRARELLRAGEVMQATTVLEGARAQAATSGAKSEEASALFYLGVAQQSRIQDTQLPESDRRDARTAAIAAYEQSLQASPASGPALNNLAQLYRADAARRNEADALLATAIELNDSRRGVYLLNRATLKRDAGDIPAALQLAEQAASEDRANLVAHRAVMDIALASQDAGPLLAYVRKLNASGLVARALDTAAGALERYPADRPKLLLSIAQSLGSPAYTALPSGFSATDAGRALQRFGEDQAVGTGVRELFAVLDSPVSAPPLQWWRRGPDTSADSPVTTMLNLLRRCAEIYRSAGGAANLELAERYYRLGIGHNSSRIDTGALIGLAELLLNSARLDELNRTVEQYEGPLLDEKSAAIVRRDDREVYDLRVALGMIYGYTKRWVNPQTRFAAAIWMLEHAQDSATSFNRGHPDVAEQIRLPPEAVQMLSNGYAQTGNVNKSVTVRLEAADRYLAASEPGRAQDVLDAAWHDALPASVDAATKQRLERTLGAVRDAQ